MLFLYTRRTFIRCISAVSGFLAIGTFATQAKEVQPTLGVTEKKETVYLWNKGSANDQATEESARPKMDIYLPPNPSGAKLPMIIICPGGGYYNLAEDHEGKQVAEWFNKNGMAAAVLFYRHRTYRHPAPYADACRAIRLMRSNAARYNVDPNKIGIMGFSAGGHLASTVTTLPDLYQDPSDNLAGKVSARPDRAILGYPVISLLEYAHTGSRDNLLGKNPDPQLVELLSTNRRVTAQTPPVFLFHTAADDAVPVQNSLLFAEACAQRHVPVALHVFPKGKHGVGLAQDNAELKIWPENLMDWLKTW